MIYIIMKTVVNNEYTLLLKHFKAGSHMYSKKMLITRQQISWQLGLRLSDLRTVGHTPLVFSSQKPEHRVPIYRGIFEK